MPQPPEPPEVSPSELDATQRRIAPMLAQGWSIDVIAVTLDLPAETVELCRDSIYRKLGTDDRAALAQWVIRHQVID
jgi:DNA-binding NarL/FixJ family response regulator